MQCQIATPQLSLGRGSLLAERQIALPQFGIKVQPATPQLSIKTQPASSQLALQRQVTPSKLGLEGSVTRLHPEPNGGVAGLREILRPLCEQLVRQLGAGTATSHVQVGQPAAQNARVGEPSSRHLLLERGLLLTEAVVDALSHLLVQPLYLGVVEPGRVAEGFGQLLIGEVVHGGCSAGWRPHGSAAISSRASGHCRLRGRRQWVDALRGDSAPGWSASPSREQLLHLLHFGDALLRRLLRFRRHLLRLHSRLQIRNLRAELLLIRDSSPTASGLRRWRHASGRQLLHGGFVQRNEPAPARMGHLRLAVLPEKHGAIADQLIPGRIDHPTRRHPAAVCVEIKPLIAAHGREPTLWFGLQLKACALHIRCNLFWRILSRLRRCCLLLRLCLCLRLRLCLRLCLPWGLLRGLHEGLRLCLLWRLRSGGRERVETLRGHARRLLRAVLLFPTLERGTAKQLGLIPAGHATGAVGQVPNLRHEIGVRLILRRGRELDAAQPFQLLHQVLVAHRVVRRRRSGRAGHATQPRHQIGQPLVLRRVVVRARGGRQVVPAQATQHLLQLGV